MAEKAKWGAGHAAGMYRLGLKELAQILPAFPQGQHVIEEQGIAGNVTNIEVVQSKKHDFSQAMSQRQDYTPPPPTQGQTQGMTP